jgi:hypothetical protein
MHIYMYVVITVAILAQAPPWCRMNWATCDQTHAFYKAFNLSEFLRVLDRKLEEKVPCAGCSEHVSINFIFNEIYTTIFIRKARRTFEMRMCLITDGDSSMFPIVYQMNIERYTTINEVIDKLTHSLNKKILKWREFDDDDE